MPFHESILGAIGSTPLVRLGRLFRDVPFEVFAKCEALNPGGSSKDRPAMAMLSALRATGKIGRDSVIVESSSGNMGVGLAQACRYFGFRFICVVDPRTASQNLTLLRAYGAELDHVTEPDPATGEFLQARLNRVQELLASTPGSVWPNQYSNVRNSGAHYESTIREILDALEGRLDFLFCAVSTCGTVRGCAQRLRELLPRARVVAVDAVGSAIFDGGCEKRVIPGLGAGIQPPLLDRTLVDEHVLVTAAECVVGCRRLAREEAILAGGSAGGVIRAIEKLGARIPPGSRCVAILADRGERYLDTVYNDEWVAANCGESVYALEALGELLAREPVVAS